MVRFHGAWLLVAAAALVAALGAAPARAQGSLLTPLGDPAWADASLPSQTLPRTRFEPIVVDGQPGWRIVAEASYGNLAHPVQGAAATARRLTWRWRLDEPVAGADLATKPADDAAIKVCVLFDMPDERVPFFERQLLRLARNASKQALPAATLCYVWAPLVAEGSVLPNAYSRRLRWKVLRGAPPASGPSQASQASIASQASSPAASTTSVTSASSPHIQGRSWQIESRDLRADFLEAFGDESAEVPPIAAVLVGADADNSGGRGEARIVGLELRP
jgi:hypothetical protein